MNYIKRQINKYKTFIKYLFSAGICTILDLSIFTIVNFFLKKCISSSNSIIISSVIARIISSLINFLLNGKIVFNKEDKSLKVSMVIQYYALVIFQLCVSSLSVAKIYSILLINETVIKFFVDLGIFFVNYFVQKKIIFKNKVVNKSGTIKRN